jgi:hypothetical protein
MKNTQIAINPGEAQPPVEPSRSPVTYNAVRHGILSVSPVIPLFESEEDWQEFRDSIFEDIQPHGGLQRALTDRVALILWRLMRSARHEREVITAGIMDVGKEVAATRKDGSDAVLTADLKEFLDRLAMRHLLPGDQELAKILRYEGRFHRQLLQTIHQIKLLKGERGLPSGSSHGHPNVDAPATHLFPPNYGDDGGAASYNGPAIL